MQLSKTAKWILVILVVLATAGLLVFFWISMKPDSVLPTKTSESVFQQETIGQSVEGRKIEAYHFNSSGTEHLVFIGGIHGGYEWNSSLLAYEFVDYLTKTANAIPSNLAITVIPSANPDGLFKLIGKEGRFALVDVPVNSSLPTSRFNANQVDLNRNFDCKWQPKSNWKGNEVSAGVVPFSEPEAQAIKNFILRDKPSAVVFWHSQSNAVYASECTAGILPETLDIMNAYAQASGYQAYKEFNGYSITGDAEGWLASINIPAITVELKTHETIEWNQNLAGITSLFNYYKAKQITK